jgi:hypothetical protein
MGCHYDDGPGSAVCCGAATPAAYGGFDEFRAGLFGIMEQLPPKG